MPEPIRRAAEPILRDVLGCAGAATLLHGVYQYSAPAAEILGGAFLIAICLLWARNRG